MSDIRRLPARASLEQLRKQAKELGREQGLPLAQAQFQLARQYGFESWPKLVHHVTNTNTSGLALYNELVERLVAAYSSGNFTVIREINWELGTAFVWDRDVRLMQQRLPSWFASRNRTSELAVEDARRLVAKQFGFETWNELVGSWSRSSRKSGSDTADAEPRFYRIDRETNTVEVYGPLPLPQWDVLTSVIQENGITGLRIAAATDEALDRLSRLDQLTRLQIESALLTDDGMQHLASLTRLEALEFGGPKSVVTDRGLAVVRHLPELRRFQSCWTPKITDSGLANLAFCDKLEHVDVMGTSTGDGTIDALRGKPRLRHLKTGRLVTDGGLPLLHDFPVFKTWQGGKGNLGLMSFDSEPNHLLLDGPFTDRGLESLRGLNGVYGINFFWHVNAMSPAGLHVLAELPHLEMLGCDGRLCTDAGMHNIAAIPRLRLLMAQGAVAGDDGFATLARSRTIEFLWGRECPNLKGRGFAALASMPALAGLGVSCKYVDDRSLATLPSFPSLRQLMPMDVSEDGFRHVGACTKLENLWCMYCRDTGDVATGHLAGLPALKTYYAGQTQITDASLAVLAAITSLEELEFWEVAGITDAGIASLARLPRLRKIEVVGSANVTRKGMAALPSHVKTVHR